MRVVCTRMLMTKGSRHVVPFPRLDGELTTANDNACVNLHGHQDWVDDMGEKLLTLPDDLVAMLIHIMS